MALTSPDNIFSPDRSKIYTLTDDLSQLTGTVQSALTRRANQYIGTSAEREASSNIPNGVHWQDTDGAQLEHVKLLDSWVPVGGKFYAGTSAQRASFTNAPEGSHWQDTNGSRLEYVWVSGSWDVASSSRVAQGTVSRRNVQAGGVTNVSVSFPSGLFSSTPVVLATVWGDARDTTVTVDNVTTSGFTCRLGSVALNVTRRIGAYWRAEQL